MNLEQTASELGAMPGCYPVRETCEEEEVAPARVPQSELPRDTVWSMMASAWTPLGLVGTSGQEIAEEVFYRVLLAAAVVWVAYCLGALFHSGAW